MIITYLVDTDQLAVQSDEISALIASLIGTPLYTDVKITGTKTCGTALSQQYTVTELATPNVDNKFYVDFDNDRLLINPLFFGLTSFSDGVYKLEIRMLKIDNAGYLQIANCIFVDILYKCTVAALLKDIVEENKNVQDSEKTSTYAHILHYSLVNGSNCSCNCDEMCSVFTELAKILSNIDPQILNDCGC